MRPDGIIQVIHWDDINHCCLVARLLDLISNNRPRDKEMKRRGRGSGSSVMIVFSSLADQILSQCLGCDYLLHRRTRSLRLTRRLVLVLVLYGG